MLFKIFVQILTFTRVCSQPYFDQATYKASYVCCSPTTSIDILIADHNSVKEDWKNKF